MTDDFGGKTVTMVDRDGGVHQQIIRYEQSHYIFSLLT